MTHQNSSSLTFELNESIWLDHHARSAEIVSLSLEPIVEIDEDRGFVTIKGYLELQGRFETEEDGEDTLDLESSSLAKQLQYEPFKVEQKEIYQREFKGKIEKRFPVDITLPAEKVKDLKEVYVNINQFDYSITDQHRLNIEAGIEILGITLEENKDVLLAKEGEEFRAERITPNFQVTATRAEAEKEEELREQGIQEKDSGLTAEPSSLDQEEEQERAEEETQQENAPGQVVENLEKSEERWEMRQEQAAQAQDDAEEESAAPEQSADAQSVRQARVEDEADAQSARQGRVEEEADAQSVRQSGVEEEADAQFARQVRAQEEPDVQSAPQARAQKEADVQSVRQARVEEEADAQSARQVRAQEEADTPPVREAVEEQEEYFRSFLESGQHQEVEAGQAEPPQDDSSEESAALRGQEEYTNGTEEIKSFDYLGNLTRKVRSEEPLVDKEIPVETQIDLSELANDPQDENQEIKMSFHSSPSEEIRSEQHSEEEAEQKSEMESLSPFFSQLMSGKEEENEMTRLKMCIIQKDESLEEIANRYDLRVTEIMRYNRLETQEIKTGQILYIPKS